MKTVEEKVAVYQASLEGKQIQVCRAGEDEWIPSASPSWNWEGYDYRVAPEHTVAKAYLHVTGTIHWALDNKNYINSVYHTRIPEFDIVGKLKETN